MSGVFYHYRGISAIRSGKRQLTKKQKTEETAASNHIFPHTGNFAQQKYQNQTGGKYHR